jgi:GT2 family glycosyltransferase
MSNSVSVVLVNWNGLQWLERLLNSLEHQTFKDIEIVFVDNSSTDNSVSFVENNYPKVKIVKCDKNYGFAGGCNKGVENASGKWIMFLNTDTWIEDSLIENLLLFAKKSKLDVVAPREADYYTKEVRKPYVTTIDLLGHPIYLYGTQPHKRNLYLSGVCLLFSKKLYLETGGLDNLFFMYFEEIDWFWRLRLLGKNFGYAPGLNVYHAGAGSSAGTKLKYNLFLWRNQNCLLMLLKNYHFINLLWIIPLYIIQNAIEIIAFICIGKAKIATTYIKGWSFNIHNLKNILEARRHTQNRRIKSDFEIFKKMYKGSAKLKHLLIAVQASR